MAETSETHTRWYLAAIVLLAALLRIPALGTIPQGFYHDEAVVGYDAYCILHTGADHYGDRFPILARTFNGYNEALNRYMAVASIAVFGLNVAAVRLPFAVSGVLSVLIIYFFALELYRKRHIALLVALGLSVSPWHVHFTRTAFPTMLLPMFVALGTTCVLRGRRDPKYLVFAGLAFGFSLFTYMSARGFVPLFVLGLFILFWTDLRCYRRQLAIGAAIFVVFLLFFASHWFSPTGMNRWNQAGAYSPALWVRNYWISVSPSFLFMWPNRYVNIFYHISPSISPLNYYEIIALIASLIFIIYSFRKEFYVLVLWILLYPFPAFITENTEPGYGNLVRLGTGPFLFALASGYGVWGIIRLLNKKQRSITLSITVIVILLSVAGFAYTYTVVRSNQAITQNKWQYGVKEALSVAEHTSDTDIYVSAGIWSAYSLTLFFSAYSPRDAQFVMRTADLPDTSLISDIENISFGRYHIRPSDRILDEAALNTGSVAILTPVDVEGFDIEDRFETIKRIDYSNGEPAYYVLRSRGHTAQHDTAPL